jgi:hypothetical protein
MIEDAMEIILDAALHITSIDDPPLRWLQQQLLLGRGHYAPDDFDDDGWVERAEVETSWAAIGDERPQRELLDMYGMGGHPGGSWAELIRAHDLPPRESIYTWETDIADVGRQATLLIATCEKPDAETDAKVVETALSPGPRGLSLPLAAMGGTLDEMRTVLPRKRTVPLLVDALDEVGDAFADAPGVEELAQQAPARLEPWSPDWNTWLVERYFEEFLSA